MLVARTARILPWSTWWPEKSVTQYSASGAPTRASDRAGPDEPDRARVGARRQVDRLRGLAVPVGAVEVELAARDPGRPRRRRRSRRSGRRPARELTTVARGVDLDDVRRALLALHGQPAAAVRRDGVVGRRQVAPWCRRRRRRCGRAGSRSSPGRPPAPSARSAGSPPRGSAGSGWARGSRPASGVPDGEVVAGATGRSAFVLPAAFRPTGTTIATTAAATRPVVSRRRRRMPRAVRFTSSSPTGVPDTSPARSCRPRVSRSSSWVLIAPPPSRGRGSAGG